MAVVSGQSRGRFSVSPSPGGLGFPALSSSVSTSLLSVSGRTDAGRFRNQQDKSSSKIHDLGVQDESAVGQNCLNYHWDPVTWLFPPVPLIPAVLQEVEEQQIEAILICPGWKWALWWPHLSKMLVQPIRWLPASHLCLSYQDSTDQVEFSMDPLVAAHSQGLLVDESDNDVVLNQEDL